MNKIITIVIFFVLSLNICFSQVDDGICNPETIPFANFMPSPLISDDNGASVFCIDGSSDQYYNFSNTNGSLPDNEYLIENITTGEMFFTTNGNFQLLGANYNLGDQLQITAATFDLVDINATLGTVASLCPSGLLPIPANICDSLIAIANGTNDGNPGINDMNEAVFFVESLAGYSLTNLNDLVSGLNGINIAASGFGLGVCFGFSETFTLTAINCVENCGNISTSMNEIICGNTNFQLPDGTMINESGVYSFNFDWENGCDSIANINLTVNQAYSDTIMLELYEGEEYSLADGTIINESGNYTVNLQTVNGCDSTIHYNIDVIVAINDVFKSNIEFKIINNVVSIKLAEELNNKVHLQVVNLNGVIVESFVLTTSDLNFIDLSNFSVGIYSFCLFDGKNKFSKNVVKI